MGLMPAHFTTTNTRRKKKKSKPKALLEAEKSHAEYLKKLGVVQSSRTPRLGRGGCRGGAGHPDQGTLPPTSDKIPGFCPVKPVMVYSGERKLLGIAAMHKSNLVPVFDKDDAKELAQMRR